MKISFKTCPLCAKALAVKYPAQSGGVRSYICSTHIPGTKLSHYYIQVANQQWVEIIHAAPFTLMNVSNEDKTRVYPCVPENTGPISNLKLIVALPRFELGEADKLVDKIKTYILFS